MSFSYRGHPLRYIQRFLFSKLAKYGSVRLNNLDKGTELECLKCFVAKPVFSPQFHRSPHHHHLWYIPGFGSDNHKCSDHGTVTLWVVRPLE